MFICLCLWCYVVEHFILQDDEDDEEFAPIEGAEDEEDNFDEGETEDSIDEARGVKRKRENDVEDGE